MLINKQVTSEGLSISPNQQSQGEDPRRSSALSRRTCSASPSTSFFPNASRNSRDLTSLAALVHSPTPKSTSVQAFGMMDGSERTDGDPKSSLSKAERGVLDWELPSLHFRPLSFMHYSQGAAERPRSSGPLPGSNPPPIISPTPERPMSSQSRRRFSKILGVDDNACSPVRGPRVLARSCASLNAGKLKSVLESPESSYHAHFSIPPFSPRNSMIAESTRDNDSNGGSVDQEQGSGCEKSTVESLLDRHIECLGLQPETVLDPVENQRMLDGGSTRASTVSTRKEESTVKVTLAPLPKCRLRAQTVSSANASITAGSEQKILIPRRLFSPDALRNPGLAAAQSSPCVSQPSFHNSSGRPSIGWKTLASTSNISSSNPWGSQGTIKSPQFKDADASSKVEVKPLTMGPLSPSTPSCWSANSEDLYNWNDDASFKRRPRSWVLERQTSERRRMRTRLKLKRNSQSQGKICASEFSSVHESFHTARTNSHDRVGVFEPVSKQTITTFESQETMTVGSSSKDATQIAPSQQMPKSHPPATSPNIPSRRSSVVAIATQRVKQGVDMVRKMSVRTARSHHSNASIIEPLNSTRLSAMAPHLGSPDLGPPLTPMSLNMNFAFPPTPVAAPPGLRTTQSFFSDDSSAVQNHRGSLRKRFNLPSLRSVLPSSPRTHSVVSAPGKNNGAANSRLHQSCQMQGLKHEEEEECDMYGTVGMSEFAYCRRRMLERVKGWWRRQCVQRKLGSMRRRAERGFSQGP